MTQESTKHTPLPWKIGAGPYGWDDGIVQADVEVSFSEGVVFTNSGHGGTGLSDEDGEFIVRAANSHDALLAALERMHLYVTDHDAFVETYGGPKHPESSISIEGWLDVEVRGPAAKAIEDAKA